MRLLVLTFVTWMFGLGAASADPVIAILQESRSSLVAISVSYVDAGGVPQHEEGTGFIISTAGYLLTNSHVVTPGGSTQVQITGRVGSTLSPPQPLELVERDDIGDVALLRLPASGQPWQAMRLVRTNGQAGAEILALGFPLGSDLDIKFGLLSNVNAIINGVVRPQWQTSLALNPGNSGGPILDSRGRVIAIAAGRNQYAESISYVIPLETAAHLVERAGASFMSEGELLLAAATYGDLDGVREHLTHESFEVRDSLEQNALMIAADQCHREVGKYIIGRRTELNLDLNATNHYGDTALQIARGTDSHLRDLGVNLPRCAALAHDLQAAGAN